MSSLLIHLKNNKQWVIAVANTSVEYNFAGDTLDDQSKKVQELAQNMVDLGKNVGKFTEVIGELLDLPEDADFVEVVRILFGMTDKLDYIGTLAYAAATADADVLLECLVEAGECLLGCLL